MNWQSNSAEARDLAHHLHSFTHLESLAEDGPLVLEGGDGIYVTDNHGRRYIEGISGLRNIVVGFGETRIAEAAYEQMKKLPAYHTFFGRTAAPVIDLAERLINWRRCRWSGSISSIPAPRPMTPRSRCCGC